MSANGPSPNGALIRVLICDDDRSIRAVLRAITELRPSLRVVGEAADGNEAISQADRLKPDVILLDLAMPHRTGLEALAELRRVAPDARIIVFSGFGTTSIADEVIARGAHIYLEKGADPQTINDTIEAASQVSASSRAHTKPGQRSKHRSS